MPVIMFTSLWKLVAAEISSEQLKLKIEQRL
jgi:hypothetical protein